MNTQHLVSQTASFVRSKLEGEGSGHDWWHIVRVWNNAKLIAEHEACDLFVVELTALLHDIADWKFSGGDEHAGSAAAREWLRSITVPEQTILHVCHIIDNLSFKGAGTAQVPLSAEGRIVQDADRLDAIGAIGIARVFAYGGCKQRELYNPEQKPEHHADFAAYKTSTGSSVNHFHEKLLLLKDRMNTATAKRIAQGRHEYMEHYLEEFLAEWDGKR